MEGGASMTRRREEYGGRASSKALKFQQLHGAAETSSHHNSIRKTRTVVAAFES